MRKDQIILSAKVSGVQDLIDVYRELARRCDYPLHLGLTEAGMGAKGIVGSTAALGVVLQEGIGDTIRVSLTPAPNGDRTEEVTRRAADPAVDGHPQLHPAGHRLPRLRPHHQHLLPGDGRADPELPARADAGHGRRRYTGVEEMKVAVMGCVVNGPGESKHANIGISLPGTFEEPKAPVYVDGRLMPRSRAITSSPSSSRSSTTTSTRTTPRARSRS